MKTWLAEHWFQIGSTASSWLGLGVAIFWHCKIDKRERKKDRERISNLETR